MSRRPVSLPPVGASARSAGPPTPEAGASLPGQGQTWTNSIPARLQKSRQAAA